MKIFRSEDRSQFFIPHKFLEFRTACEVFANSNKEKGKIIKTNILKSSLDSKEWINIKKMHVASKLVKKSRWRQCYFHWQKMSFQRENC